MKFAGLEDFDLLYKLALREGRSRLTERDAEGFSSKG